MLLFFKSVCMVQPAKTQKTFISNTGGCFSLFVRGAVLSCYTVIIVGQINEFITSLCLERCPPTCIVLKKIIGKDHVAQLA